MDKALVFQTKDCRFEPCQDQGVGKAREARGGLFVTGAAWADAGARQAIAVCARPRALPRQMASVITCSGGARYPLRPRCGPQAPLLTPHIAGRLKLDRHARPLAKHVSCTVCRASFLKWSCGLMDKALVFGTKDCRFESC